MKNYVQDGDIIRVVCPAGGRNSGDGVLVDALFGVATHDAEAGAELEIKTRGVFDLAKNSAEAFTQGQPLYWDNSPAPGVLTGSAPGNVPVGVATEAAANPSSFGRIKLNESYAFEANT